MAPSLDDVDEPRHGALLLREEIVSSITEGNVELFTRFLNDYPSETIEATRGDIDKAISIVDLLLYDLERYLPLIDQLALPLVLWEVDSLPSLLDVLRKRGVPVAKFILHYRNNIRERYGRTHIIAPRWLGDAIANEHIVRCNSLDR